jgi:hypothetical protein
LVSWVFLVLSGKKSTESKFIFKIPKIYKN